MAQPATETGSEEKFLCANILLRLLGIHFHAVYIHIHSRIEHNFVLNLFCVFSRYCGKIPLFTFFPHRRHNPTFPTLSHHQHHSRVWSISSFDDNERSSSNKCRLAGIQIQKKNIGFNFERHFILYVQLSV